MPGIVGLITKMPRQCAETQLRLMVKSVCHEPAYVSGTWSDENLGIYLGWAGPKGSFPNAMPLRNERQDVALFFSGEDFPEPDTARRLQEHGHQLESGALAHLVHRYEEDPSFLASLNGWFQGLLIDRTRQTVVLFNDRYGLHRVYYHEAQNAFYFAGEAKAILAARPELRRADPKGLGELVACGCVLENRTVFQDIYVLPPGSAWTFRQGAIQERGGYFNPREWENQDPLEPEEYYRQFREVFSRNLPRYFNGHDKTGVSLTGGLDCRMIMAWQKSPAGSLPCYSFGGIYRDCRDVVIAREVAQACGQPHTVIRVGEEFLSRFPHYAERSVYLSDGCADVTRSADLYVNERAAEIAPIRMTGNYGGEILRQVRMLKASDAPAGVFCQELVSQVKAAKQTCAVSLHAAHPVSFAAFRQAPLHHYGLLSLERTQLRMRSPYLDNDLVRTALRAPASALAGANCLRLIADGDPVLAAIPTDLGVGGKSGGLAKFRRKLQTFTFKAEYAYDYGMPQWWTPIDRRLALFKPERMFLGRHKFFHFRIWYREALSADVREMLLNRRTLSRPYLNPKGVESIVRDHLKGTRNYTIAIHKVLTLEFIHRLFVD